jgi:hypothetical protein
LTWTWANVAAIAVASRPSAHADMRAPRPVKTSTSAWRGSPPSLRPRLGPIAGRTQPHGHRWPRHPERGQPRRSAQPTAPDRHDGSSPPPRAVTAQPALRPEDPGRRFAPPGRDADDRPNPRTKLQQDKPANRPARSTTYDPTSTDRNQPIAEKHRQQLTTPPAPTRSNQPSEKLPVETTNPLHRRPGRTHRRRRARRRLPRRSRSPMAPRPVPQPAPHHRLRHRPTRPSRRPAPRHAVRPARCQHPGGLEPTTSAV